MINKFINQITPEWTKYEITSMNDWKISIIDLEDIEKYKNSNIYILWGVRNDLVYSYGIRAKDSDIVKKSYFLIDLDIRKEYKEIYDKDISDTEIFLLAEMIKNNTEDLWEYFSEWSYIIFTWNWLHIYYIWDSLEISPKDYSLWVERIYRKWNEIMWESIYYADNACKNIARISRLPWTINQKNWSEVKILYHQEVQSRLIKLIPLFAEETKKENKIEQDKRQKEYEQRLKEFWNKWNELYETINMIPAYQIAQVLLPEFAFDWKKNFKKWKFLKWYYYVQETNTICNWGSHEFNWWNSNSCWNNFSLVQKHKNFTAKETFEFFKKILN
jgi:hypothetical protein